MFLRHDAGQEGASGNAARVATLFLAVIEKG
jgi:hypothetical protein